MSDMLARALEFEYTNYRGETSTRRATPLRLFWGYSGWHDEPQWLLEAFDHGKGATRGFALKDCTSFREYSALVYPIVKGEVFEEHIMVFVKAAHNKPIRCIPFSKVPPNEKDCEKEVELVREDPSIFQKCSFADLDEEERVALDIFKQYCKEVEG